MVELVQMWALVEVLGLICLPLTMTVCKNLPDRGWAFSKIIGMALLAFCVWLPLMTIQALPFSQFFVLGVLLLILALNIYGFTRTWRTIVETVRAHLTYVIVCELLYLGMIFLLGIIRSYNPNIQSFEMFMDEGFLASILRSPHFPPQDMWLAGYPINYYYYAHYTIAVLAKLLNQPASIAFNTGICTFFGLTAINIFGVTSNIVAWARHQRLSREGSQPRRVRPGLLSRARSGSPVPSLAKAMPFGAISVLMGLLLGNLASTQDWWKAHDSGLPYFYWFNVSRVVPNTINEFPAFSFLLSCFHAHVLTLAFTILAIGLAFNLFLERGDGSDGDAQGLRVFGRGWRLILNLGFTALTLGGLFAMNGWDLPTYLGLAVVCIALQQWMAYRSRFSFDLALDVFTACASLTALTFFLYAPFYLNFISPAQGIGVVDAANRSSVPNEILIYGTFMFVFVSFLLINLLRDRMPPEFSVAGLFTRKGSPGPRPFITNLAHGSPSANGQKDHARVSSDALVVSSIDKVATGPVQAVAQARQKVATAPHPALQETEDGDGEDDEVNEATSQVEVTDFPDRPTQSTGAVTPVKARRSPWLSARFLIQISIFVVALLIFVVVKNSLWLTITFIITALATELTLYHMHDRPRAFVLLLGATAFFLVAMTEVVFLKDVFAANFPRMNTVFKFYFQAWALLSITSGAALYFIFESFLPNLHLDGLQLWLRRSGQAIWTAALVLLLLAGAIYPIVGAYQRTNDFAQRSNSLDGMAYLQDYSPGDYYAIQWLNSHIQGDPTIVEAYGPEGGDYTDYNRISAFTGLPTIIGWAGHEYQWRVNWLNNTLYANDFYSRGAAVNAIYTSKDPKTVLDLMARYSAQYLYVGNLELSTYVGSDLSRFSTFMTVVYSRDGVTIYQVPS
jgi:uncharacterized membrane protein